MKRSTLFILLVLIALGWLFFFGKEAGIDTPLSLDRINLPAGLADKIKFDDSPEQDADTTIYKWQDEQGAWHYGDQPPKNVKVIPVTLYSDPNILPTAKPPLTKADENREHEDNAEGATPGQQALKQKQAEVDANLPPSALPVPYQKLQEMLGVTITPQKEE